MSINMKCVEEERPFFVLATSSELRCACDASSDPGTGHRDSIDLEEAKAKKSGGQLLSPKKPFLS